MLCPCNASARSALVSCVCYRTYMFIHVFLLQETIELAQEAAARDHADTTQSTPNCCKAPVWRWIPPTKIRMVCTMVITSGSGSLRSGILLQRKHRQLQRLMDRMEQQLQKSMDPTEQQLQKFMDHTEVDTSHLRRPT